MSAAEGRARPRASEQGPIVETRRGRVEGTRDGAIDSFRAIPYAATPHGRERFEPPRPHPGWAGIRPAIRSGATPPQVTREGFGRLDMSPYFGPGWVRGEDYLSLNIWAPARRERPLPVVVFVHGGGFVSSSIDAGMYDGSAFARDGIVFVSVGYRLGVAGFLDVPGAPRNRGLLDVAAALEWVRHDIAAFGGDPDDVTLCGQSAGATIVAGILATGAAAGTFRRAIVQSGSGTGAFSPEQAAVVAARVADRLGVAPGLDGLSTVDDEDLVAVLSRLGPLDLRTDDSFDPLLGLSPLSLVLDRQPAELVARGAASDIDLLVTTNADEGDLYLSPQGLYATSTDSDIRLLAAKVHGDPDALVDRYRRNRPGAGAGAIRAAILGDGLFGVGSRLLADAHAAGGPGRTWAALFTWRSGALDGELGAAHTVELPFVFDRLRLPALNGDGALLGADGGPQELADQLHGAWVRFASTGDPGWEPYSLPDRLTRELALGPATVSDPRRADIDAWASAIETNWRNHI